jgi:hypothetical protein
LGDALFFFFVSLFLLSSRNVFKNITAKKNANNNENCCDWSLPTQKLFLNATTKKQKIERKRDFKLTKTKPIIACCCCNVDKKAVKQYGK